MARAGNHPVRIPHLYHHHAESGVVRHQDFLSHLRCHPLALSYLHKLTDIFRQALKFLRVNQRCAGDIKTRRFFADHLILADNNYICNFLVQNLCRRLINPAVLRLRQNNCFSVLSCPLLDFFNKAHLYESPFRKYP